eukprot:scaffold86769_cov50-Phaeocystis_antarctica.AAC.5
MKTTHARESGRQRHAEDCGLSAKWPARSVELDGEIHRSTQESSRNPRPRRAGPLVAGAAGRSERTYALFSD